KLGYELRYRDGDKSITQWLPFTQNGRTRNILPNSKNIDERQHVIRFDAAHEWQSFRLADSFRFEFYELDTKETQLPLFADNLITTQRTRQGNDIQALANALSFEKL